MTPIRIAERANRRYYQNAERAIRCDESARFWARFAMGGWTMGRRLKLTPEMIERICTFVRMGLPYEVAARAAGIGPSTFYRWKALGERARSGIYREFWEALNEAEAVAEATLVARIFEESKKNWQAAAWMLKQRFPERWGRGDLIRYESDIGKALAEILERLADRGGAEHD